MTDDQLLRAIGSRGSIAAALGLCQSAITVWAKTGIPARHRPAIFKMAKAAGVPIDIETFFGVKDENAK